MMLGRMGQMISARPLFSTGEVAMLLIGTALIGGGVWMLRIARRVQQAETDPQNCTLAERTEAARGLSSTARMAHGLLCMFGGYHLVAWALPPDWLGLKVPQDQWKTVLAVLAALAVLAWALDKVERREGTMPE